MEAKLIKETIKTLNISQKTLAIELGVSYSNIAKVSTMQMKAQKSLLNRLNCYREYMGLI